MADGLKVGVCVSSTGMTVGASPVSGMKEEGDTVGALTSTEGSAVGIVVASGSVLGSAVEFQLSMDGDAVGLLVTSG
ncbi:MAG: hypothetical protein SGARI_007286, partial [Bacillariaceae sp.]